MPNPFAFARTMTALTKYNTSLMLEWGAAVREALLRDIEAHPNHDPTGIIRYHLR